MLCLRAATAWSKWTDSNRHHRAWKARILPLDHTCLSEPKARVELASPSYQDGALSLELHRHRPAAAGRGAPVEPWRSARLQPSLAKLSAERVVERPGFEPGSLACDTRVFPLDDHPIWQVGKDLNPDQ